MKTRLPDVNSKNPWPLNKLHSDHMKGRQKKRRTDGMTRAEKWAHENYLSKTGLKWTREAAWGFRLFDFWNHALGVAVEIDGPEHNSELDRWRDHKEWERSRIIVIRIKNFNEIDGQKFLEQIKTIKPWTERRKTAGMFRGKSNEQQN